MQYQQSINQMFNSGRFQCDLQFYQHLLQWTKALDLYQYQNQIQTNLTQVSKIVQLTQQHSNSLAQNYDQKKAIHTTKLIHQQIKKINIQSTQQVIKISNSMNQQSYRTKIKHLIQKYQQNGKPYIQISTQAWKNVHTDQLRVNNLVLVAFYMVKNRENVKKNIEIYNKAFDKGMNDLKNFPQNIKFIQNHPQIAHLPKIQEYISGSLIIAIVLLRFYSVMKVLQGRSNLSLKLNSLKVEIQKSLTQYPKIAEQNIQQQQIPIDAFKGLLRGQKQNIKLINECCIWCLKPGSDLKDRHKACEVVIRLYFYQ